MNNVSTIRTANVQLIILMELSLAAVQNMECNARNRPLKVHNIVLRPGVVKTLDTGYWILDTGQ